MNEQVLCVGLVKKSYRTILTLTFIFTVFMSINKYINAVKFYRVQLAAYYTSRDYGLSWSRPELSDSSYFRAFIIFTVISVVLLIAGLAVIKTSVTVTDMRVYGKAVFGKRVDLPIDSVSSVSTGMFNAVAVATSSGKVNFIGIANRGEVYDAVNYLLMNRQMGNKHNEVSVNPTTPRDSEKSAADMLTEYKELFDMGIITQEEFDKKKKELLGL